jgi:hypothetical protein
MPPDVREWLSAGHYRAHGRMKNGRRLGAHSPPKPWTPPDAPQGRINATDPDSRVVKGLRGFIQGYNAQAVTNEQQIVLAAEIMVAAPDFGHLEPMLDATQRELQAAGVTETPRGSAGRCRLLASPADGTHHRSRHPSS